MVIIKISKKPLKIAAAVILLFSIAFSICSYMEKMKIENRYESLICIVNQYDKTNLIPFLASNYVSLEEHKNIEIFDIKKGEVIQSAKSSSVIQKEVEGYLKGITGMYSKVKAFPDKGYIIRVPFDPPKKVQNNWLNDYGINSVNQVFILFPEQQKPYLLVLDEKQRPIFYNFQGNIDVLLGNLDWKPLWKI